MKEAYVGADCPPSAGLDDLFHAQATPSVCDIGRGTDEQPSPMCPDPDSKEPLLWCMRDIHYTD